MANTKAVIPFETYNNQIIVYISDKPELVWETVKGRYDFPKTEQWDYEALTFSCENGGATAIIFNEKADVGTVAHECLHAVSSVLKFMGIKMLEESEECYAYSLGYLTKKVMDMFNKHNKKREREIARKQKKLKTDKGK